MSYNIKKTEIVLFRAQETIIKKNINFEISGWKVKTNQGLMEINHANWSAIREI